jgi:hypothetical protein
MSKFDEITPEEKFKSPWIGLKNDLDHYCL